MIRFFFFLILSITPLTFLSGVTVADKLFEASKGDFVVTEQDKNYSLLLLREKNKDFLVFEEISIPCAKIHLPGMDWEDWVGLGAPGHTSWIQYEINAKTLKLVECYSYSKKGWLYMEESEHFFSKLLSLSLNKVPLDEKKKIGPAPIHGEPDRRPYWTPTLVVNTKKEKVPSEAWKTFWPKDDTILSSCRITLYFPPQEKSFFPLWIEANNGHFNYSIRGIYLGKNLTSPTKPQVPKRSPRIVKSSEKTETHRILGIKTPAYYQNFSLFVFDVTKRNEKIGPIPFKAQPGKEKEALDFLISNSDLSSFLVKNHRYKWILQPTGSNLSPVESDDFFLWSP